MEGKLNAYVLLEQAPDPLLEDLRQIKEAQPDAGVRFISRLYGAYQGVVAVVGDDFAQIQSALDVVRNAGAEECAIVIEIPTPPGPAPVHGMKQINALTCCAVAPEQGKHVFEVLSKLPAMRGIALTAGATDILLEVGAESFEELGRVLVEDVAQVPGITHVQTSFLEIPAAADGG